MQPFWRQANITDISEAEEARTMSESIMNRHPGTLLDHDLAWIGAYSPPNNRQHIVFFCQDDSSVFGYAPFSVLPSSIPFTIGELMIWKCAVRQVTLHGEPLILPSLDSDFREKITKELFREIRCHTKGRCIILLASVPCDSALYRELLCHSSIEQYFHVFQYAAPYKRRLIALPGTFEEYLKQLGPKTRADLNRHIRRLKNHVGESIAVKCYTDVASVDNFLDAAKIVSKKTYQWNLLERGLRNHDELQPRLMTAAQNGWLRCYILFCKERPVAFMMGFTYRGRYYSTDIGYDPEWTCWSVGNVLHCEVVRDLIEKAPDITLFDFLGDRPTHERLSNGLFIEEATFYLFPKSVWGSTLHFLLRLADSFSIAMARILDLLKLKMKIRKVIRSISTRSD